MAWEGKKYELATSENFDEYMKEIGISFIIREMGNRISSTCYLERHGDEYHFYSVSAIRTYCAKFKLGEEKELETLDGRKVLTTFTLEGNTLTQVEKTKKLSVIIREFSETEIIATSTYGDVTARREYKVV